MTGEQDTTTASNWQTATETIDFNYTGRNPVLDLANVRNVGSQLKLYDICVPIIGCLIIVTNLIVVLSSGLIIKNGVKPKTTYLFLGNVAMADLVTAVAILLDQYYPKPYRTHLICAIMIGMIVASTIASVYTVGLIAVDRFLYIVHGLKYNRWMYPKRARLLIVFTWVLGMILGFLPATGLWTGTTDGGKICWLILLAPPGLVLLITIIGILPISLIVILYSIILYHAIKKVIQLRRADKNRANQTADGDNAELRIFRGNDAKINAKQTAKNKPSKIKAIKVVMFTCGSIVLTWIPYLIACSMYVFCDPVTSNCKAIRVAIASPLAILGFMNSLFNPIIYAWWHTGFRSFMKKLLCKRYTRSPSSFSPQQTNSEKL